MAGLRVHFVFPAGLVERVDAALTEGESRGEFVRAAVEFKLSADGFPERFAEYCRGDAEQALGGQRKRGDAREAESPSAPAEQPEAWSQRPDYTMGARSSVQAKRDVRPVPKAGEK